MQSDVRQEKTEQQRNIWIALWRHAGLQTYVAMGMCTYASRRRYYDDVITHSVCATSGWTTSTEVPLHDTVAWMYTYIEDSIAASAAACWMADRQAMDRLPGYHGNHTATSIEARSLKEQCIGSFRVAPWISHGRNCPLESKWHLSCAKSHRQHMTCLVTIATVACILQPNRANRDFDAKSAFVYQ